MPTDQHTRVRRAITRSKRTFRAKIPSQKMGRMIHCESLLEADCVRYLEAHPAVRTIREQPRTYEFSSDERIRTYTPDLEIELLSGARLTIEVKPSSKLVATANQGRISALTRHFKEIGEAFHILTERDLRAGHLQRNLRHIQRARRNSLPPAQLIQELRRLLSTGNLTHGDLQQQLGEYPLWTCVAHFLVVIDLFTELTDKTVVQLAGDDYETI